VARIVDLSDGRWEIEGVAPSDARALLARHAPWRMQLNFTDGPGSDSFETFEPFNAYPLRKLQFVLPKLDLPTSPAVLDVGFNCGYNSLYMAGRRDARVTGIDVLPRHKALADELADLLELDVEFLLDDAQTFVRDGKYDLVLHFGTLYHLPNPLLSVENTARSLKPGGWFALETTRYTRQPDCAKWIFGYGGDRTNYWAIGETIIADFFAQSRLSAPELISSGKLADGPSELDRAIWIAQRL
jgi:SAM-dependent methyltransferase